MTPPSDGRSFATAIARMLDAGQRLMARRLELFRVKAVGDASRIANTATLAIFGVLVVTSGWMLVLAALTIALAPWVPPPVTLAGLGAVHVLIGAIVVRQAGQRLRLETASTAPALESSTEEILAPALEPSANETHEDTHPPRPAPDQQPSGRDRPESTGVA